MEPKPQSRDLGESFSQMFELIPALDDAALEQVYRIRHDVYCRDLGWEPVRADGRESDEYDAHSYHCLLRGAGRLHAPGRGQAGRSFVPAAFRAQLR